MRILVTGATGYADTDPHRAGGDTARIKCVVRTFTPPVALPALRTGWDTVIDPIPTDLIRKASPV